LLLIDSLFGLCARYYWIFVQDRERLVVDGPVADEPVVADGEAQVTFTQGRLRVWCRLHARRNQWI
jgi:hypothetical protein